MINLDKAIFFGDMMPRNKSNAPLTLAIDIGGTGLKMMVVDSKGKAVSERTKVLTPQPATPNAVIKALMSMTSSHGLFSRVSVGFPGVVKNGVVKTAPNLGEGWADFNLAKKLHTLLKKPTRVGNDADVQGLGDISGKGVEMVITLGTGMGSALFVDGKLVPNLELGHHPFHKDQSYEDLLGKKGLKKLGKKKWNKEVEKAVATMERIFNFDKLYIGGGNTHHLKTTLPKNVVISSNIAGLLGGVKLWEDQ